MQKKFFVFDLDGTLLNTLPDIANAMNQALGMHGLGAHPEEAYKRFTGNGVKVLSQRAAGDEGETAEKVRRDYMRIYAQNSRVMTKPYEGIPQALADLEKAGYAIIVFSNKDDPDAKEVVRYYFPQTNFAWVLGSQPGVPLKPDPTALKGVLETLGLDVKDGIYVGDTRTDMQTARAAGVFSVAVCWGFQTRDDLNQEDPDRMIGAPADLLTIAQERFSATI